MKIPTIILDHPADYKIMEHDALIERLHTLAYMEGLAEATDQDELVSRIETEVYKVILEINNRLCDYDFFRNQITHEQS